MTERVPTYAEMMNAIRAATAAAGAATNGLPAGGTPGQYLEKSTVTDYDAAWTDLPNDLPVGGSLFQSLVKASAADYDVAWGNPAASNGLPAGGTAAQILTKASATNYDATWTTGGLVPSGTALQILACSGGTASAWTDFSNYSALVKVVKDTTVRTSTSNTALTATGLTFTVASGVMYHLKALGAFQSAATTTGLGLGFSSPPATTFAGWSVQIEQAAAGTDQMFTAAASTLASTLVSASVVATGTAYQWEIEARFQPSAAGTITVGFRSEVSGSQITWNAGAVGILTTIG